MHVLISGSSGLVGSALSGVLASGGHRVSRLLRGGAASAPDVARWDPDHGQIDAAGLSGVDAVVHLGGAGIADRRWSQSYKTLIRESREKSTRLLSETLARLDQPPQVFACASAIGIYGDRGDEVLDESSAAGADFLAEVGRAWEGATNAARDRGIRVVHLRFGVILSARGGALVKMLTPFKLGLGGRIGSGRQYMSWITLDDVLGAIQHVLANSTLSGPVNVVAPNPATNAEFTSTLGKVLRRPTIFPMPAFAARLAFGEMADALLLSSQRVAPRRLIESGFGFRYPVLEDALRSILDRVKTSSPS